jgi:hypothetical protein
MIELTFITQIHDKDGKFEDTKRVIRTVNRRGLGNTKVKGTNINLQNTTQKTE